MSDRQNKKRFLEEYEQKGLMDNSVVIAGGRKV